eukprot:gene25761-32250_t
MALNGWYKYVYFRYLTDNPLTLEEIPLDRTIRIRVGFLKIDWLVVEAKLEPKTKKVYDKLKPSDDKRDTKLIADTRGEDQSPLLTPPKMVSPQKKTGLSSTSTSAVRQPPAVSHKANNSSFKDVLITELVSHGISRGSA